MMRWGTGLKLAAIVVVGGGVAIAGAIATTDFDTYKERLAGAIAAETGYRVALDGEVTLSLGRTVALAIDGVRLNDARSDRRSELLRVAHARAEVALAPLWHGEIVIQRLDLRDADINVEIDRKGQTNFAPVSLPSAVGPEGNDLSLRQIGEVDIRDARVRVRDARNGRAFAVTFSRLQLRDVTDGALVRIAAAGTLKSDRNYAFDVAGRAGGIATLFAHQAPYPVDLRGTVAGVKVAAAGTVADPFAGTGLALHVELAADNLRAFASVLGEDLASRGPARLSAALSGAPETFRLAQLSAKLADNELVSGDISVDRTQAAPRLDGRLAARWLDLSPWLTTGAPPAGDEVRLLSTAPMSFAAFRHWRGRLALSAETLVVDDLLLRDAATALEVRDGRAQFAAARARLDGRELTGELVIEGAAQPPRVALRLAGRDADVGRLLGRIFADDFIHGRGGLDVAIAGRGRSLAEIAGSWAGHVRILMDRGEVRTGRLNLLVGGVSSLFSGGGDWTAINCAAADFAVRDGLATSRVALLDTESLRLVGEGSVNFADDTLDFHIAPSAKSPTLNVAVPVNVRGAMTDPSITPDELSLLARLGGLVGAVFFPPAAILSLGSLGSHDNPCLEAVRSADAGAPAAPTERARPAEADVPPEPGAHGNGRLIDAVKRLLPLRGDDTQG